MESVIETVDELALTVLNISYAGENALHCLCADLFVGNRNSFAVVYSD